MKPPGVVADWNDCDVWTQANLIAYSQLRGIEDAERDAQMMRAMVSGRMF